MIFSKRRVVGLDVGTTAVKLGVFDAGLRPLLSLSAPVETRRDGDRVELDAERVASDVRRLLDQAARELGTGANDVVGLGIAAQRSTTVFWTDKGVLSPTMTWQDLRAAADLSPLSEHEAAIEARTGLRLTAHYSAPKIRWAIAHLPEVRAALEAGTLRAAPLSSFLVWRLTAGRTYAVDHSQGQRTLLMNLARRTWDPVLLRRFGIPRKILPSLREVRSDYGSVSFGPRKIPILASVGDTQAAAFASGLGRKADLTIQFGTGAFVARALGPKPLSCPGLLTSLYVSENRRASYFVEGTVNSAGSLLEWLRANPELARRPASLPSPILVPALNGLGSPHWLPQARPVLFGPPPDRDLAGLGAEGVACRLREILRLLQTFGPKVPGKILVSGGLARDEAFLQAQADVLGQPLVLSGGEGTAAAGAAGLVFGAKALKPVRERKIRPRPRVVPGSNDFGRALFLVKSAARRKAFAASVWTDRLRDFRPLFFAHRGASHIAAENTLTAFDLAVRNHADGIECDVRLTKDGVPVLLHDSSLARTTGRNDIVEQTDARNLPSEIPTLAELLEFTPENLLLYVEIKSDLSGSALWESAGRVAAPDRRVAFCSFDIPRALRFKSAHPDLLVGAIIGRRHPPIDPAKPLYPELDLVSFRSSIVNPRLIERCRLQTQVALVWTVDRESAVRRFVDLGADGIVTNRIEKFNVRTSAPKRS